MRYQREILSISNNEIRRCRDNTEEEWVYCISDVVVYVVQTPDPYDYLFRLRMSHSDLWRLWNNLVIKIPVATDLWNYNLNCMNLHWLWWLFRAIPKKYEWRKRIFKSWVE